MKKSEKPASKETSLDDSIQLAIRDEVEKRVEQRENIYWKFGGLFAGVVVLFFIILWRVSISEIRETVEKQLAEKEVVKARDRIMAINSAAEDMNHNLIAISSLMNTNQQQFLERLNQIKQQDNVLTVGDLSNLFISEKITNWANGKLHLSFEPIPGTVKIYYPIILWKNCILRMKNSPFLMEPRLFLQTSQAVLISLDTVREHGLASEFSMCGNLCVENLPWNLNSFSNHYSSRRKSR